MDWYWWYALSVVGAAGVIGAMTKDEGRLTWQGVLVAMGLAAIWPPVVLWLLVVALLRKHPV